jgi:hypothetical protein
MEDLDRYLNNSEIGIEFLIEFFDEFLSTYKEKCISTKNLLSIVKGKYIVENFKKIEFEGSLEISSTQIFDKGGISYSLIINSDEITLSSGGYNVEDGVGSDSFGSTYFEMGNHERLIETFHNLEYWNLGFIENSNGGVNIIIKDEIENFQI